jgi:hypothetical protein
MEYSQKLKDPRWQKKRLEIMQRDEFMCQRYYDSESTLNIHHFKYIKGKEPWDYDNNDLITLCEMCHRDESESRKYAETQLLEILKDKHFYSDHIVDLNFGLYYMDTLCCPELTMKALSWAMTNHEELEIIENKYIEFTKLNTPRNANEIL